MSFAYIHPYSPELAQIEIYFGMLKRIVIKKKTLNEIKSYNNCIGEFHVSNITSKCRKFLEDIYF